MSEPWTSVSKERAHAGLEAEEIRQRSYYIGVVQRSVGWKVSFHSLAWEVHI